MVTTIDGQPPSTQVRAQLAADGDPVLLAFSCGKDSIAAWLALRDAGVKTIIPYYMQYVPGLRFVEDALAYYEDVFATRILRVTHPSLYRWLNNLVFQPPERCATIEAAHLPMFEYEDVIREIRTEHHCPAAWVADGVRANDSIMRRLSFTKHGIWRARNRKVSPIWDWSVAEVRGAIARAGVNLPPDYEWFGRSFDGIDYRFLKPLSVYAPEDYQRVLDWFPLADLELFRATL